MSESTPSMTDDEDFDSELDQSRPDEDLLYLFIETLTGTSFEMAVSPQETILSIKAKLQRLEGISIAQQHLLFNNTELPNNSSLADCEVPDGGTLKLVLAMRGGPINTRQVTVPNRTKDHQALHDAVEVSKQDLMDHIPRDGQVTVLVFREGDELNLYHVVERSDGSYSPLSESWSGTSIRNLFAEPEDEEVEQRLAENANTMSKMQQIRNQMENMTLRKKRVGKQNSVQHEILPQSNHRSQFIPQNSINLPPIKLNKRHDLNDPEWENPGEFQEVSNLYSQEWDTPGNYSEITSIKHRLASQHVNTKHPHRPPRNRNNLNKSLRNLDDSLPLPNNKNLERLNAIPPDIHKKKSLPRQSNIDLSLPTQRRHVSGRRRTIISPSLTNLDSSFTAANQDRMKEMSNEDYLGYNISSYENTVLNHPDRRQANDNYLNGNLCDSCKVPYIKQHQNDNDPMQSRKSTGDTQPNMEMRYEGEARQSLSMDARRSADTRQLRPGLEDSRQIYVLSSGRRRQSNESRLTMESPGRKMPSGDKRLKVISPGRRQVPSGDSRRNLVSPGRRLGSGVSSPGGRRRPGGSGDNRLSFPTRPLSGHRRKKTPRPRCADFNCKKRLLVTSSYSCRCGHSFCSKHRLPETHQCQFDYKTEGRKLLAKANPMVAVPKLPKI